MEGEARDGLDLDRQEAGEEEADRRQGEDRQQVGDEDRDEQRRQALLAAP
jgi:hypothetical protein